MNFGSDMVEWDEVTLKCNELITSCSDIETVNKLFTSARPMIIFMIIMTLKPLKIHWFYINIFIIYNTYAKSHPSKVAGKFSWDLKSNFLSNITNKSYPKSCMLYETLVINDCVDKIRIKLVMK